MPCVLQGVFTLASGNMNSTVSPMYAPPSFWSISFQGFFLQTWGIVSHHAKIHTQPKTIRNPSEGFSTCVLVLSCFSRVRAFCPTRSYQLGLPKLRFLSPQLSTTARLCFDIYCFLEPAIWQETGTTIGFTSFFPVSQGLSYCPACHSKTENHCFKYFVWFFLVV